MVKRKLNKHILMIIKFKKLHSNAVIPQRASSFAGGWDVVATEIIQESEDFVICKLGFALQPPFDYKVTLVPRSSLTKTHWILQNSPGLGDPDYLGEYQFRFRALPIGVKKDKKELKLTYPEFPYKIGDRIGQIYFEEIVGVNFEETEELYPTKRGSGGFGSTNN